MKYSFEFSKAQLKTASAVCSDLVTAAFLALFAVGDIIVLTQGVILVIVLWKVSVKLEEALDTT